MGGAGNAACHRIRGSANDTACVGPLLEDCQYLVAQSTEPARGLQTRAGQKCLPFLSGGVLATETVRVSTVSLMGHRIPSSGALCGWRLPEPAPGWRRITRLRAGEPFPGADRSRRMVHLYLPSYPPTGRLAGHAIAGRWIPPPARGLFRWESRLGCPCRGAVPYRALIPWWSKRTEGISQNAVTS